MRIMRSAAASAALAVAVAGFTPSAQAGGHHGDAVVAGVAGLAVGALLGNAAARPRYYSPAPVYVAPPPPPVVVYQPVPVYQPAPVYYAPPAWSPEWYAYCSRTYADFDPRSGTIVDYDGYRRMCR